MRFRFLAASLSLAFIAAGYAADRPATQPTQPGVENRPGAPFAGRVERAVSWLKLTSDERTKVFDILDPAREQIDKAVADGQAKNEPTTETAMKVRRLVTESKIRVFGVLPPAQRDLFAKAFDQDRPAAPVETANGPAMNGETMNSTAAPSSAANSSAGHPATTMPAEPTIAIGDPMPAFTLTRLDGHVATEKLFRGRPAVFIFGSMSAPSFRDGMPRIAALSNLYGINVTFVCIYTREMYPADQDQPERNTDDKISVAAHKILEDRATDAKLAKQKLGIPFDVVPDSMDDKVSTLMGGFPNGAAIFDGSGKLVAHFHWAEPFAIRRTLDAIKAMRS